MAAYYAPINVKPYPPVRHGITKGFEAKFCPQGGAARIVLHVIMIWVFI